MSVHSICMGFPGGAVVKTACRRRRYKRWGLHPWVKKIAWRRKWQAAPVFLAWKIPRTERPGGLQSMGLQSRPWLHAHTQTRTEKIWRVAVYLKEPGGPPGTVKERQVQPVPDRVSPPGGWRGMRKRSERTGIVFPVWRKKREAVPEAEGLEAEKADVKGLQALLRSVGFISGTMGSN